MLLRQPAGDHFQIVLQSEVMVMIVVVRGGHGAGLLRRRDALRGVQATLAGLRANAGVCQPLPQMPADCGNR